MDDWREVFAGSEPDVKAVEELQDKIQKCNKCQISYDNVNIYDKEKGLGKLPTKIGKLPLMMIGIAPSINRFVDFKAFSGRTSGDVLDRLLLHANLNKEMFYYTNVLRCSLPNNRQPEEDEIKNCVEYLEEEISLINPDGIFLLGGLPTKVFNVKRGEVFFKDIYGRRRLVASLPHPAYFYRNPNYVEGEYKRKLPYAFKLLRESSCQRRY